VCFEPRILYYSREPEVYIPYFDGNKNVEDYLDGRQSLIKLLRNSKWLNILDFSCLPYVFKNMVGLGGNKGNLIELVY